MIANVWTGSRVVPIEVLCTVTAPLDGYRNRSFLFHRDIHDSRRFAITEPISGHALVVGCRTPYDAYRRLIKLLYRKSPAQMDAAVANVLELRHLTPLNDTFCFVNPASAMEATA